MDNPINQTATRIFRFLSRVESKKGHLSVHYGPVVKGARVATFKFRDYTRYAGHLTVKINAQGRFKVLSADGELTPHRYLDRLQEFSTKSRGLKNEDYLSL